MLSTLASELVRSPRNRGPLEGATHRGVTGIPGDGPYVEIWLVVDSAVITNAAYRTHGCPSSMAASSMICELARGRECSKLLELTSPDLLLVLGGLPEGKEQFAAMAVQAMHEACQNAMTGPEASVEN